MTNNFNNNPTQSYCTNDPSIARPLLAQLADGTVKGSAPAGNGHSVLSATACGAQEHGKAQHTV